MELDDGQLLERGLDWSAVKRRSLDSPTSAAACGTHAVADAMAAPQVFGDKEADVSPIPQARHSFQVSETPGSEVDPRPRSYSRR
jgi:hypothetical protein